MLDFADFIRHWRKAVYLLVINFCIFGSFCEYITSSLLVLLVLLLLHIYPFFPLLTFLLRLFLLRYYFEYIYFFFIILIILFRIKTSFFIIKYYIYIFYADKVTTKVFQVYILRHSKYQRNSLKRQISLSPIFIFNRRLIYLRNSQRVLYTSRYYYILKQIVRGKYLS